VEKDPTIAKKKIERPQLLEQVLDNVEHLENSDFRINFAPNDTEFAKVMQENLAEFKTKMND